MASFTSSVCVAALGITAFAGAQTATVIEFPQPAGFYLNTTFAIDGDTGYVPSTDNDTLWSFSLVTGDLIDPDGLALPAPGTASDPFLFAGDRLAIPGWFPGQGIFVADVSDPANLAQVGVISFPGTTNIQGQNVEIADDGVTGFVAGFPDDTLYSFSVDTMALVDPDGLALPGNPDRIARAGDRLAMVDTTNGRIMVADVSDPANLTLVGTIALPHPSTFGSNDNIVFADDGRTGFVSSNERRLYSFDVQSMTVLDPDGIQFGTQSFADDIAIHGSTIACIWSRGLAFFDASDPTDLALISNANFGGTVAPQGSATVEFSADGTQAAMPVIFPDDYVYVFDVATGAQVAPRFLVDDQPNYLTVYGNNTVGVLCAGNNADTIWLIDGLLDPAGQTILPISFFVGFGAFQSGTLADLFESDDAYVRVEQRPAVSVLLPLIRVEIEGLTFIWPPSVLEVTLEAGVNSLPTQPPQRLTLFNFDTSGWETVDERTATLDDSVVVVTIDDNAQRFVAPGSTRTALRAEWFDPGNVFSPAWGSRIDQALWTVTP